jgi:hypothetical protein
LPRPIIRAGVCVLTAGLIAPAATVADAAVAAVPTVSVGPACQLAGFGLTASLAGFTPGGTVHLSGEQLSATGLADATGRVRVPFLAPMLPAAGPGSRSFTLTATDDGATPLTAATTFRVANFAFDTSSGTRPPRSRRRWSFSGLTPGRPVYGHFRFGGRTRGTYRFGVAAGPCGELTVKAPGIVSTGRIPAGRWSVQIDQRKAYSPATKPRMTGATRVTTAFRG